MSGHMWVNLTFTPVEVQVDGDTLHTFTTELGEELARDDGELGCFACGKKLTIENYDTPCEPEQTPKN